MDLTCVASPERSTAPSSDARAVERFSRESVAARYPSEYRDNRRDRRERVAILKSLGHVPQCALVLDLPCGTGRLTRLLLEQGYRVTAADASRPMLLHAEQNYDRLPRAMRREAGVEFHHADVMTTPFADGQFDAVICNRLFHHFIEGETRRRALTEIRRICSGVVIVSFFNSFAIDAVKFRLRHALRRTVPNDRIPIPMSVFDSDLRAAGLQPVDRIAQRWGVSPMWYVVARRM